MATEERGRGKASSASTRKRDATCAWCREPIASNTIQCPSCLSWDPLKKFDKAAADKDETVLLTEVKERPIQRFVTGIVDANFGGGIPLDSVTLIAGKAGGGKSTLSIQLCDMIASVTSAECLYIAAEESSAQIKERAKRLALASPHLIRLSPMGADNDIGEVIERRKPKAVILDSLPGFVTSDDEAVSLCNALKLFATKINAPFIVIDHINKADDFAGKEALQHAVDITMTLFPTGEGEQRELFTHKNRYGKAQVSSLFDMTEKGLVPSISGLAPDEDREEDEEEEEGEDNE